MLCYTEDVRKKKNFWTSRLIILTVLIGSLVAYTFAMKLSSNFICANSISCIKDLSGKFEEGVKGGEFIGREITLPKELAREKKVDEGVLGEGSAYKRIQIDLTKQRLYAFEGENQVFEFPISSGKWFPTPTGTFSIWIKLRYSKMEGGTKALATYYYLPNVPHIMYFYNEKTAKTRGFGIHGAYWHNNFGHPMSHGCVNLPLDAAEKLFAWADPPTSSNATHATSESQGTRITIYGETPRN